MVEKVSDRARKRIAQQQNNATITKLRNQEKVSKIDEPNDITKVEKTPNLNYTANKNNDNKQKSKKTVQNAKDAPVTFKKFVGKHKKGSIIALIVFVAGVLLIIGSILVSGPMQYLQFTSLVKNSIQFMSDSVSSSRVMRNIINIAQGESYTPGSDDSRDIGGISRLVTDYYVKNLSNRGIEFSGGSTITIDVVERYKQDNFNREKIITRIGEEFRINTGAIDYNENDKNITINTSIILDDEYEGFLLALEKEVDNFATNELSATRRQLSTRRLGLNDWLHTISHSDQVELRKTMSYLEAWYASRLAKMTGQELRDSSGNFDNEVATKLKEILDVKMVKRVINVDVEEMEDTTENWMMLALAMACVVDRVYAPSSDSTTQLYARVVIPSIIEALTLRSIDGQIRSIALNTTNKGLQDFTFDDLTGSTQDYFYDNIELANGDTVPVNGWSSAPVKAALGYNINELDMAKTVDYALRFLEFRSDVTDENNPATIVGDRVYWLCRDFFNTNETTNYISEFLAGGLSEVAVSVMDWIKTTFDVNELYWAQMNRGVGEYSLQTFSMDPAQKLSTAMYGSKYFEDYDNTLLGGKALTEDEVAIIYGENQEKLASEYQEKPIVEKLFDTSDYRSAISSLARKSNWDTSESSFNTHLANIVKTFASLPQLIATSFSNVFGNNVNAAETNQVYDYGTQWYGYSTDERKDLNKIDNQMSLFTNAKNMFDLINREGKNVNNASIDCFSTQILRGGVLGNKAINVIDGQSLLNEDGTFNLNYIAGGGFSHYDCRSFDLSDDDMYILRTYLLDYNLMAAGACYLAVAYPEEKFDNGGKIISYEEMMNPACLAFY